MRRTIGFLAACMLVLLGCSGGGAGAGGETFRGGVAGIVFDEQGIPVRDARVFYDGSGGEDRTTRSNSNGVYVLTEVPTGDRIIRVEATTPSNVRYFGTNVARIERGERTMNHNIAVYRDDRLASIEGQVFDRNGNLLQGARVFVKQVAEATVLSSSYGITNGEGRYTVGALRSGIQYDVQVNALDYNSDWDAFTLNDGERRHLDFTIPVAEDIVLDPPTGIDVTAWTSPAPSRDAALAKAIQNIKRLVKPGYKAPAATNRGTSLGGIVEIDVLWAPIFDDALLGYGIYRSEGAGALRDIYLLRDPLAEIFADMDEFLRVGSRYNYRVTTISTIGNESEFSAEGSAVPLGDLVLRSPSVSNRPTFRWNASQGAQQYVVYLFDRYPSVGVEPIWDNESNPTSSTSLAYDGSSLPPGDYFYIVVGIGAEQDFALSEVGDFDVP